MADKSISELPVSPGMTDDALLVVYQNGETESIEGGLIKGYARESVKQFVESAATSAGEAEKSATAAKKSEDAAKENADKTAADVLVVEAAADEELARQEAERARVEAEGKRVTGEEGRDTAEGDRDTSEQKRVTDETARHEAEEERKSGETTRQDNETTRGTAEGQRATNETQRGKDEGLRKTAEEKRATEEGKRSTAETKRAEEEGKRAAAETNRVTEEGKRATSEGERETSETERIESERLREAASAALSVWEPYDPAKPYVPLNKVAFGGSSYVCTAATTGHAPTDAAYWLMIAQKGVDGEGAGDMTAEVYDPHGKAQDVFAYADAKESAIKDAPAKDVPVDADSVVLVDSADGSKSKQLTWAAVKAALKTYFDGLYSAVTHSHAWSAITGKPTAFTPSSHAASHWTGGADPLTAADVGALATTGGKMTGDIDMGNSNIRFGRDFVHGSIAEDWDGGLLIEAKYLQLYRMPGTDEIPRLKGLGVPVSATDAANKQYVDEKVAGAGGLKQFGPVNITIPLANWTGTGPWTQNVAVAGVLAAWDWRLTLSLQKQTVTDTRKAQEKALGCVKYCDTYNGGVTLTCYEKKPEISILAVLSGEV